MPFGKLYIDIVPKILIRSPGYLIYRAFKKDITLEDAWCLGIGVLFWGGLIAVVLYLYCNFSDFLTVDSCLDAGGAYCYQTGKCVYR